MADEEQIIHTDISRDNVAFPLILNPATAAYLIQIDEISSIRPAYSEQQNITQDEWDNYGHRPFLFDEDNSEMSPSALVPSLKRSVDEPYELQYQILTTAIESLIARRKNGTTQARFFQNEVCSRSISAISCNVGEGSKKSQKPETSTNPDCLLSNMLARYISEVGSDPVSRRSFLSAFDRLFVGQGPFCITLSPSEYTYYNHISRACQMLCAEDLDSDSQYICHVRENLIRFWLGLGSMEESLRAVRFLLSECTDALSIRSFLSSWTTRISQMRRQILRVSSSKHFVELGAICRKVSICRSFQDPNSEVNSKKLPQGRKWDWEDDHGWERYDNRVSQILEDAYQMGKTYVDFHVDGKPDTYRADFTKMMQRNVQSGKQRKLRSLLALLIKDEGRVTQTVEINMPHNTLIQDLRRELSNYLKHDEKALRIMYCNKILRRSDYQHLTIREGIVPLGAEPLVVYKMEPGELEDRCSFVHSRQKAIVQSLYECRTCEFLNGRLFCGVCATVCHKDHSVRLISTSKADFCYCGATAGIESSNPCRALEDPPVDSEKYYTPSICSDPSGDYIYTLSSEYGLVKIGTGRTDTITGKIYQQETRLSVHAGCKIACVGSKLLIRSPMLSPNVLLKVNSDTFQVSQERIVLQDRSLGSLLYDDVTMRPKPFSVDDNVSCCEGARSLEAKEVECKDQSETHTHIFPSYPGDDYVSSWTLEYCVKSEDQHDTLSDDDEDYDDFVDWGHHGKHLQTTSTIDAVGNEWRQLPTAFVAKIKEKLAQCRFEYGDLCYLDDNDHSMVSASFEEEGLFLRRYTKNGIKRSRIRIKHRERVLPFFASQNNILVVNLDKTVTTTRQAEKKVVLEAEAKTKPKIIRIKPDKVGEGEILFHDDEKVFEDKAADCDSAEFADDKEVCGDTNEPQVGEQRKYVLYLDIFAVDNEITSPHSRHTVTYCAKCGHILSPLPPQVPAFDSEITSCIDSISCPICDVRRDNYTPKQDGPFLGRGYGKESKVNQEKAKLFSGRKMEDPASDDFPRRNSVSSTSSVIIESRPQIGIFVLDKDRDSQHQAAEREEDHKGVENEDFSDEIQESADHQYEEHNDDFYDHYEEGDDEPPGVASEPYFDLDQGDDEDMGFHEQSVHSDEAHDNSSVTPSSLSPPPVSIDQTLVATLVAMGFSQSRVERALAVPENRNLDAALNWIIAHEDHPTLNTSPLGGDNTGDLALNSFESLTIPFSADSEKSSEDGELSLDSSDNDESSDGTDASDTESNDEIHSSLYIDGKPSHPPDSLPEVAQLRFLHFSRVKRLELNVVIDNQKDLTKTSNSLETKTLVCDGCGVCNNVSDSDQSPTTKSQDELCRQDEGGMYVCLDRSCENVQLCKFCYAMGVWQSKRHSQNHMMEFQSLRGTSNLRNRQGSRTLRQLRLALGQFSCYCDTSNNTLVFVHNVLPAGGRREQFSVFDMSTGELVIERIYLTTWGDTFCFDHQSSCVWSFSVKSGFLERWQGTPGSATEDQGCRKSLSQLFSQMSVQEKVSPSEAASTILSNLYCFSLSRTYVQNSLILLNDIFRSLSSGRDKKNLKVSINALGLLKSHFTQLQKAHLDSAISVDSQILKEIREYLESFSACSANEPTPDSTGKYSATRSAPVTPSGTPIKGPRPKFRSPQVFNFDPQHLTIVGDGNKPQTDHQLVQHACEALVEGFEVLYPTWKSRIVKINELLKREDDRTANTILNLLHLKYRGLFTGLRKRGIKCRTYDPTMLTSSVQASVQIMIHEIARHDSSKISQMGQGKTPPDFHLATYFLLCYQADLIEYAGLGASGGNMRKNVSEHGSADARLKSDIAAKVRNVTPKGENIAARDQRLKMENMSIEQELNKVREREASRKQRRTQLVNKMLVNFAASVFSHSTHLLENIQFYKKSNSEKITDEGKADAAEQTLEELGQYGIGKLLPWSIIWLPQSGAVNLEHEDLSRLSSACIALIVRLSRLFHAAVAVTRCNKQRVRLGNTRAKISQLRSMRKLVRYSDGGQANGTDVWPNKCTSELVPFAKEVFSDIFLEFAVPNGRTKEGQFLLSRQDLADYLLKCGSQSAELAIAKVMSIFSKYGLTQLHHYGDDPSRLSLAGFLQMYRDACLEDSQKVVQELECLEHRHRFLSTHHPNLSLLEDLKVAFAGVLQHLFSSSVSHDPPAETPPYMFNRTLEEELNRKTAPDTKTLNMYPEFEQDVILQLVDSHDQWRQDPRHGSYQAFCLQFVESKAIFVPCKRGRTSISQIKAPTTPSSGHSAPDALSILFHKCLMDMGKGFTQISEILPDSANYFEAEKAFAAACIKHSGLSSICLAFARSLDIMKLINNAKSKGTRCMYQPLCPRWFQDIVKTTYKHVRGRVLGFLRSSKEKRQLAEEHRSLIEVKPQKDVIDDPKLALLSSKSFEQNLSGLSDVHTEKAVPQPSVRKHDVVEQIESKPDQQEKKDDNENKQEAEDEDSHELMYKKCTLEADCLITQSVLFITTVTRNSIFILSDFTSESFLQENDPPHLSIASIYSDDDDVEDSSDSSDEDPSSSEDSLFLDRVQSEFTASRSISSKSNIRPPRLEILASDDADADDDPKRTPGSARARRRSESDLSKVPKLNIFRSPSGVTTPGHISRSPSLSSWTGMVSDQETSNTSFVETIGSKPYFAVDSVNVDWIASLVTSELPLGRSLSSAIQTLQTAMLLRRDILVEVNKTFQIGCANELLDDVLVIIFKAGVIADIQHSNAFRSRDCESEDALLFFYKYLGHALQRQVVEFDRLESWSRTKVIFQFFCEEFQPQDCDIILGSGMLPVLSDFMHKLGALIKHGQSAQVSSDQVLMAGRLRVWTSQILTYLTSFTIRCAPEEKRQQQLYTLASSVGQKLTNMLEGLLKHIFVASQRISKDSTPGTGNSIKMFRRNMWPLQCNNALTEDIHQLDENVFYTIDVLHMLEQISLESVVCSDELVLHCIWALRTCSLTTSGALPASILLGIVKLLQNELLHHNPTDLQLLDELLLSYGDTLLEYRLVSGHRQCNLFDDVSVDTTENECCGHDDSTAIPSLSDGSLRPSAQFRRIAVLICPVCQYLEFPACGPHKSFLTKDLYGGHAGCSTAGCDTATNKTTIWQKCQGCKKVEASVRFWLISESEATYCGNAIKSSSYSIIPHNVFVCDACSVAEFPGTEHGLTLNIEGGIYDRSRKCFLSPGIYPFTHLTSACKGCISLTPVRLSREEASYLGNLMKTTPANQNLPVHGTVNRSRIEQPWAYKSWDAPRGAIALVHSELIVLFRSLLDDRTVTSSKVRKWKELVTNLVEEGLQHLPILLTTLCSGNLDGALKTGATEENRRLVSAILAVEVLGAHGEIVRQGAEVEVIVDGQKLRGTVVKFDRLMSTAVIQFQRSNEQSYRLDFPLHCVTPVPRYNTPSLQMLGLEQYLPEIFKALSITTEPDKLTVIEDYLSQRFKRKLVAMLSAQADSLHPYAASLVPCLQALCQTPNKLHFTSGSLRQREVLERLLFEKVSLTIDPCYSERLVAFRTLRPPHPSDRDPSVQLPSISRRNSVSSVKSEDPMPVCMPVILQHLETIVNMGFSRIVAKFALAANAGDMEQAVNAIITGQVYDEEDIDDTVAEWGWEALLDRLRVRDQVEAYQEYQSFRRSQPAESVPSTDDKEKKLEVESLISDLPLVHRFRWPADSDSHAIEEKTKTTDISKAEQQGAQEILLAKCQSDCLLHTRVLITEEAARVWKSAVSPQNQEKQYRVGDKLTLIDLVHKVCPAEVVEVSRCGKKIFVHYVGWSKKWDEWVEVDSKRIQPDFKVGDRLTVFDSVNKESEAVVQEVSIRENTLKILVHYCGWSPKWDEWLAATSKRIIARHKAKPDKTESEVWATSLDRIPHLKNDLEGRVGIIVKIDPYTKHRDRLVLVRVDDNDFHCTLYLWMKLCLLQPLPFSVHPPNLVHFPPPLFDMSPAANLTDTLSLESLIKLALQGENFVLAHLASTLTKGLTLPGLFFREGSNGSVHFDFAINQMIQIIGSQGEARLPTSTSSLPGDRSSQNLHSESIMEEYRSSTHSLKLHRTVVHSLSEIFQVSLSDINVQSTLLQQLQKLFATTVTSVREFVSSIDAPKIVSIGLIEETVISPKIPPNTDGSDRQVVRVLPLSAECNLDSCMSWMLQFYSDPDHTVLLEEVCLNGNSKGLWAAERSLHARSGTSVGADALSFILPCPVYVKSTALFRKHARKRVKDKNTLCKMVTVRSCKQETETLGFIVDLIIRLRRNLSARDALDNEWSATVEHFARVCFESLRNLVVTVTTKAFLPTEMQMRWIEILTRLLVLFNFSYLQYKHLLHTSGDEHVVSFARAKAATFQKDFDLSWICTSVVPAAAKRYASERLHAPIYSIYMQRLVEFLVCALRFELNVQSKQQLHHLLKRELLIVLYVHRLGDLSALEDMEPEKHTKEDFGSRNCKCSWCAKMMEKRMDDMTAISFIDLSPDSIWPTVLEDSNYCPEKHIMRDPWDGNIPIAQQFIRRLVVDKSIRVNAFEAFTNATGAKSRARPEIAFHRNTSQHEKKVKTLEDHSTSKPQSMFEQLCQSFIKSRLHALAAPLRGEMGAVTWKTVLSGALDQGAAGLPGPFRQALYEICADLTAFSQSDNGESDENKEFMQGLPRLLIPCPNSRSQTGDDRNKLIVNPSFCGVRQLLQCRIFGQLVGVAIRSRCCLDLDLAEIFWKQLLEHPLDSMDLKSVDFTAWQGLTFRDPVIGTEFDAEDFKDYFSHLTYVTVLSDGETYEVKRNGKSIPVEYEDRWEYARLATRARLQESCLQMKCIREGLLSVIPKQALSLLSPGELELLVCGTPTVDLEVLQKHTVYSPSYYSASSPEVVNFWKVLSEFSDAERAQFLQFAWARSRLPSESGSYRMQLNIVEPKDRATADSALPTTETCFFNVHLPRYSNIDIMRDKLKLAIQCVTITS